MMSAKKRAASEASPSRAVHVRADEPSRDARLSTRQQCFLQALLARGLITVDDAEELYRCARRDGTTWSDARRRTGDARADAKEDSDGARSSRRREIVEDAEARDFARFWGDIAVALKFCDLTIRAAKFEGDGKVYMAVVNESATAVAKLATRLSPAEIALFRVTLDDILRDDESAERGVEFMTALNYTELQMSQLPMTQDAPGTQMTQLEKQTQTVQKMSKSDKETAFKQLVDEGWLSRSNDGRFLRLGPRTFLELREFILDQAPEAARERWDKLL